MVDSNTIDPENVGILVVSFAGNTVDSKGTLTCNRSPGPCRPASVSSWTP